MQVHRNRIEICPHSDITEVCDFMLWIGYFSIPGNTPYIPVAINSRYTISNVCKSLSCALHLGRQTSNA